MNYCEFTYDTVNDQTIEVEGETNGSRVKFKCYENGKPFPRSKLTAIDIKNIEEEILQTADEIYELSDVDYYNES